MRAILWKANRDILKAIFRNSFQRVFLSVYIVHEHCARKCIFSKVCTTLNSWRIVVTFTIRKYHHSGSINLLIMMIFCLCKSSQILGGQNSHKSFASRILLISCPNDYVNVIPKNISYRPVDTKV